MCRLSGCDLQTVVVVIAGVTATPHFNEHLARDRVIGKRHNYTPRVTANHMLPNAAAVAVAVMHYEECPCITGERDPQNYIDGDFLVIPIQPESAVGVHFVFFYDCWAAADPKPIGIVASRSVVKATAIGAREMINRK